MAEGAAATFKLALIGFCVTSIRGNFTRDEVDAMFSSLKLLTAGKCILTTDAHHENSSGEVMKYLGEKFISTVFFTVDELAEFVRTTKPPDDPTAIVIKVKTTTAIKPLLTENFSHLHWYLWFIIAEDDLDEGIRIPFNCQLFQMKKAAYRKHRLIEVYNIKNMSASRVEFGFWSPDKGLTVPQQNMYRRRMNLKGISLKITVCYVYKMEKSFRTFWRDTAGVLNYSLITYATYSKSGKANIVPKDLDGSACLSAITALDFDKDWIFNSFGEKVRLLMKFRGSHEVGWRAYVQPFTREMWTALGAWLLLSTVAIVLVNGCTKETFFAFSFTGFFCLCNKDPLSVHPSREPVPFPTKVVYLTSVAVPAVLVPAYSAYILSTLSVILPFEPFNDIKGFIADGTYRLAVVDNTFAARFLRGTKDPELNYIYDHLFDSGDNQAPSFSALFEKVCKEKKLVGLFVDAKSLRKLFKCRMFIIERNVVTISTGLSFPKGSPLRRMFKERFTEYDERGLKRRAESADLHFKNSFEEEEALQPLRIFQVQALFLLLLLGIAFSLIVLAAEIIVDNYSKRRTKPTGSLNRKPLHCRRRLHNHPF